MTDKFTDTPSDLEIINIGGDDKLHHVIDLFNMVYEGFALVQKQIVAGGPAADSTAAAKLNEGRSHVES